MGELLKFKRWTLACTALPERVPVSWSRVPMPFPAWAHAGADNRLVDLRTVLWLLRPTMANTQQVAAQARSLRAK